MLTGGTAFQVHGGSALSSLSPATVGEENVQRSHNVYETNVAPLHGFVEPFLEPDRFACFGGPFA
jgi:hypothetical protein